MGKSGSPPPFKLLVVRVVIPKPPLRVPIHSKEHLLLEHTRLQEVTHLKVTHPPAPLDTEARHRRVPIHPHKALLRLERTHHLDMERATLHPAPHPQVHIHRKEHHLQVPIHRKEHLRLEHTRRPAMVRATRPQARRHRPPTALATPHPERLLLATGTHRKAMHNLVTARRAQPRTWALEGQRWW